MRSVTGLICRLLISLTGSRRVIHSILAGRSGGNGRAGRSGQLVTAELDGNGRRSRRDGPVKYNGRDFLAGLDGTR